MDTKPGDVRPLAPAAAGGDHLLGVFVSCVFFSSSWWLNKNPSEKIWVINLIIFPNKNRGEKKTLELPPPYSFC